MSKNIKEFFLKSVIVRIRNKEQKLKKYEFYKDYYESSFCNICCDDAIDETDVGLCIKCNRYVCYTCSIGLDALQHPSIKKSNRYMGLFICKDCYKECPICYTKISYIGRDKDCYTCIDCNNVICPKCMPREGRCITCMKCTCCGIENREISEKSYQCCVYCDKKVCNKCLQCLNDMIICNRCMDFCCKLCGIKDTLYYCSKCYITVCMACLETDDDICNVCAM